MILTNVKNQFTFLVILTALVVSVGCSSSPETTDTQTKKETDEDYIFDEIPQNNVLKYNSKKSEENIYYFQIQIGAFSTRERAIIFSEISKQKLDREFIIINDNKRNLFLVRLDQLFSTKSEAELIREMIISKVGYEDAWIVKQSEK